LPISAVCDIKLPTKIKTCGRPKGAILTTIGLPKKKGLRKPVAFRLKHYLEQQIIIIQWLTNHSIAQNVRKQNYIIQREDIKTHVELIHMGIVEPEVNINLIKPLCSTGAWDLLKDIIELKKEINVWVCPTCQSEINDEDSILCNSCLTLYHKQCVNITSRKKKSSFWFCLSCYNKFDSLTTLFQYNYIYHK